jgi:pimeloyl-ACP methyl ester carboxylesterase
MPMASTNGVELCWESQGEGIPLVLIMGIDAQLIHWPQGFCDQLLAQGFRVVRFDNRDIGLSSRLDHLGPPSWTRLGWAMLRRRGLEAAYTLWDMAEDTVGLLDTLGLGRVHMAGMSMGGMIAQCVALRHPERLISLTSISSTTGSPRVPSGKPSVMWKVMKRRPKDPREAIAHSMGMLEAIGSPGFPVSDEALLALATRANERGHSPEGTGRQAAAILASGSRRRALASVSVPTLVLHGEDDPLIPVEGGHATAEAIPGARLITIPGWGHDLPPGLWPTLAEAIGEHARRAEAAQAAEGS